LSTATNNNVECVTFSPDGTLVAYGRTAVNVLKIGLPNGSDLSLGSGTNPVFSVAFSPDGSTLAATDQSTIQIWTNGSSWVLSETITNEAVRATRVAYSPNGNLLMCGREDGTVTMSPNTHGALGQPTLLFNRISNASGHVNVVASVEPWTHYIIQSSADLTHWSFVTQLSVTNTSTLPVISVSNTNAAAFLRALTPP
jgi:WD40 repeat protein